MAEKYISVFAAIQAKPEFLNENHENKEIASYAKGWNACISVSDVIALIEIANK